MLLEALEIPLKKEHADWMGIPWDDAAGQGPLEAWHLENGNFEIPRVQCCSMVICSDSVVALAAPSPVLNRVGAEIALRAEDLQLGKFIL